MDARWSGEAKYQALLAVAQAANSCRDLSSVLEVVAGALQELVPIDLIGVVTHERDTVPEARVGPAPRGRSRIALARRLQTALRRVRPRRRDNAPAGRRLLEVVSWYNEWGCAPQGGRPWLGE